MVKEILARHGLGGEPARMPLQGVATEAWATAEHVVKVAHQAHRDQVYTEALVAPLMRDAGVRTPALIAWAREPELAYSIWQRVDGEPLDERSDAEVWREVGRLLARAHGVFVEDPRLHRPKKRDARPYLASLPGDEAEFFAGWLDRCERAPAAPPRLLHNDVQGMNILCPREGATLIDWADAAWFDPAYEFGSMPMTHAGDALDGYEETATLGDGAEGRILTAVIGYAVRKRVVSEWTWPLDQLMRWLDEEPPARFREWLP